MFDARWNDERKVIHQLFEGWFQSFSHETINCFKFPFAVIWIFTIFENKSFSMILKKEKREENERNEAWRFKTRPIGLLARILFLSFFQNYFVTFWNYDSSRYRQQFFIERANHFSIGVKIRQKKKKKLAKCVFEEKKSLEWLPDTNPQMFQFNVKKINCIVLRYFFPPSLHCQLTDTVRRAWNTGLREDTFSGFFFPPPLPIRKRQTAPRLEKLALIITKRASRDKTSEQFSVPRRYSIDPLFSLSLSLSLSIFLLSLSIF